jgi:hypothetical protein
MGSSLVFLMAVAAVVGTLAKFGLIALGVGCIAFVLLAFPARRASWTMAGVIGLIVAAVLAAEWLGWQAWYRRFSTTTWEQFLTLDMRVPFWRRALPLLGTFPWFGTGFGTFASALVSFQRVGGYTLSQHLLNDYLEITVETGWLGLALWAAGVGGFFLIQFRRLRRESSYFKRYVGFGLWCGLIAFMSHAWLISNLSDPCNAFYFVLFLGLSIAVSQENDGGLSEQPREAKVSLRPSGRAEEVLIVGLVALSLFYFVKGSTEKFALREGPSETALLRAQRYEPDNADVLFQLARHRRPAVARGVAKDAARMQALDEARAWMEKAVRENPYHAVYRSVYADILLELGRPSEGDRTYHELAEKIPYDSELQVSYAFYCFTWADGISHLAEREKIMERGADLYRRAYAGNPQFSRELRLLKQASLPEALRSAVEARLVAIEK